MTHMWWECTGKTCAGRCRDMRRRHATSALTPADSDGSMAVGRRRRAVWRTEVLCRRRTPARDPSSWHSLTARPMLSDTFPTAATRLSPAPTSSSLHIDMNTRWHAQQSRNATLESEAWTAATTVDTFSTTLQTHAPDSQNILRFIVRLSQDRPMTVTYNVLRFLLGIS